MLGGDIFEFFLVFFEKVRQNGLKTGSRPRPVLEANPTFGHLFLKLEKPRISSARNLLR